MLQLELDADQPSAKCLYNAGRQPDCTFASCGRQKSDSISGDFVAMLGAIYACDFLGLLGFVLR